MMTGFKDEAARVQTGQDEPKWKSRLRTAALISTVLAAPISIARLMLEYLIL